MKGQSQASILAIAAAATLLACASKGPVNSTETTPAGAQNLISPEYQSVIDHAQNPTVCRRVPVTGSRLQSREICLTPADMDDAHERAVALLNASRRNTDTMP